MDARKLLLLSPSKIQELFTKGWETRLGRKTCFVDCINIVLCLKTKKTNSRVDVLVELFL